METMSLVKFIKPPPKGTQIRPWIPDLIQIPLSRAFERLGVYLYNRVISRSEIGLYHKYYNPRVHGPYCHYRYYGKLDTKLMDVKLSDLPAWFSRREKTIGAFYNEVVRLLYFAHYKYAGAVFESPIRTLFRIMFAFSFLNWIFKFPMYFDFRQTLYHW